MKLFKSTLIVSALLVATVAYADDALHEKLELSKITNSSTALDQNSPMPMAAPTLNESAINHISHDNINKGAHFVHHEKFGGGGGGGGRHSVGVSTISDNMKLVNAGGVGNTLNNKNGNPNNHNNHNNNNNNNGGGGKNDGGSGKNDGGNGGGGTGDTEKWKWRIQKMPNE